MTTLAHLTLAQHIRQIDALLAALPSARFPDAARNEFERVFSTAVVGMARLPEYASCSRAELVATLRACFPALTTRFHA